MTEQVIAPGYIQSDSPWVASANAAVQGIEGVIAEVARTSLPILFVGESGTGKETFANRVHQLSQRSKTPLERIYCASVKSPTFWNRFGLKSREGRDGESATHTVLLDEISDLDAGCQRELLCALPDGGALPHTAILNARLISTTSRNMDEELRAGRFRSELYYRLSCICLRLPPLRERKEDISALVEFFLEKHASELGRPRPTLNPHALEAFVDHSWPGNIRELENVVKEIVAAGDDRFAVAELRRSSSRGRTTLGPTSPSHSLKAAARAASRSASREAARAAPRSE